MIFMNETDGGTKLRLLVDRLSKTVDRRRKYHLFLATGYFSQKAADQLIDRLTERLKIEEIWLYLPRSIAVSKKNKLDAMIAERGNFCVYPVRGNFFHTKAYCLASCDNWNSKDAPVTGGCLAVGSANLTGLGLVTTPGNVESLVVSKDLAQIEEFLMSLENIKWMEFDELHKYEDNDEHDFQYDLLSQGKFAYRYTTNLNDYLAIKYSLSHETLIRQQQGFEDLGIPAGFETETSTISKRYFDFDISPYRPTGYRNLKKKYGIECYLGHWIPKIIVPSLENEQFMRFKTELFCQIRDRLESITLEIRNDYNMLADEDIIETGVDNGKPSESFIRKVDELEEDDNRLLRIWSQLEFNDLPYDRNDTQGIEQIYDNIITTIELSKRKNSTKRAVNELRDEFENEGEFIMPEFSIEDGNVQLNWRDGMGE